MPTTEVTLPLLPATNGVVLPGMVVTIAAESDEAKQAFASAERHGSPSGASRRRAGVEANSSSCPAPSTAMPPSAPSLVEQLGSLPNGTSAAVVRGTRRVHVGQGSIGDSGALEVQITEIPVAEPDDEARRLASEYRDVARRLLDVIGGREAARSWLTTPPRRARRHDRLVARAHVRTARATARDHRPARTPAPRAELGPRRAHRGRGDARHRRRGQRALREDAARSGAAPPAARDPGRARRVDRERWLPRTARRAR